MRPAQSTEHIWPTIVFAYCLTFAMIKDLGFALYGPLAASTRYRLGQFAPGLAAEGINLCITSLLGDEYLRRRFQGGELPLVEMMRDGAERLRQLRQLGEYDLAILY